MGIRRKWSKRNIKFKEDINQPGYNPPENKIPDLKRQGGDETQDTFTH